MNKPCKLNKKARDLTIPKQRSPLTDLNRTGGTGCFRFLKPNSNSKSSSSSQSNSNSIANSRSNSNSISKPKSNFSTNSSFFPTRSAPPKNPPNGSKQKKVSKPVKPLQSIVILTPEREKILTPPIQASISPEIPCGSSVAPSPVCFAAGHVVTGVMDRRKCRPRGILNTGNESEVTLDATDKSSPSLPPLIAGASIEWLSTPSEITNGGDSEPRTCSTKCQAEASVDWFLSPHEKPSNGTSSRFFPVQCESPFEKTPILGSNSGTMVQRTPSSNSSISPFSVILKRASESSVMKLPGFSFQFKNDFTPLNSVDLSGFTNPNRVINPESQTRISWRDGLVSRIFEMGEKDCCVWLSDCEDEMSETEDPFEVNSKISRDQDAKCAAESFNVEREDELLSSNDSDWKLLYKNKLFEL